MWILAITFGSIVGLSLGLTGGGGAIFAVPMLVYGMVVEPRQAVGISLAAVGATSFAGFLLRWKAGETEVLLGLSFAIAGMIGAPFGSWLSAKMPESLLLTLFALLMLAVSALMWRKSYHMIVAATQETSARHEPTCQRDATGKLHWTSPCALVLGGVGLVTGVLSGLFGVGGGFVIVPALVFFSRMAIHRAVGTSLLVVALVSLVGVASHVLLGGHIPLAVTGLFVGGGLLGMAAGIEASRYLSGPSLQKVFAMAIVFVAVFIIFRTHFS